MIKFATTGEMAEILGVAENTLAKKRLYDPDDGPPFVKAAGRVRYPLTGPNSLETWLADRVQGGGVAR